MIFMKKTKKNTGNFFMSYVLYYSYIHELEQ